MLEVPPTHCEVCAALDAVEDAAPEPGQEAIDHHPELRLLAPGLREDECAPLAERKKASADAVRATDHVVANGYLCSAEAKQHRPATEDAESNLVTRLPAANESAARAYNLTPVAMTKRPRTSFSERHHRTGSAYALFRG